MSEIDIPEISEFYKITPNDFNKTCEMLGKSFRKDPIWSKIMAESLDKFSLLYAIPLKYALKYGVVYGTSNNLEGIAIWLDSSKINMNIWRLILAGAIPIVFKLGLKNAFRMRRTFAQSIADRKNNIKGSYLYLLALGVDENLLGKGIGTMLVTKMIDALPENTPIYLETETERNVGFYEKMGFKVVNKIIVPSYNLPLWEMIHPGKISIT